MFIMLSLISFIMFFMWLFACLFAVGQLYNTYNLWEYFIEAPLATFILAALFAAFVGFLIAAIRVKDRDKSKNKDKHSSAD